MPWLPKIVEGKPSLGMAEGSTLDDARRATMGMAREVLSVADESGRLLYSLLVGEEREVSLAGFAGKLRDLIVSHNHPRGSMLSPDDVREAIECDMLHLEAVCPDGTIFILRRPAQGWPPPAESAIRAYGVAVRRAMAKAGSGLVWRNELLKQLNRAFADPRTFGERTLKVERSRIE